MDQVFNCPSCGAPLAPQGASKSIVCKYCGETVVVPKELRERSKRAPQKPLNDGMGQFIHTLTGRITIITGIIVAVTVILPILLPSVHYVLDWRP